MRFIVASVASVAVLAACPPVEPLDIPADCNPLAHTIHCGLPYPSNHFLVDDNTMPTGKRVEIGRNAELRPLSGRDGDVTEFISQDGFSLHAPVVFSLGVRVDRSSLPGINDDPAATIAAGFPIALIRARDGARVPFFVDVDGRATDDARQGLTLRPLVKLDENTRYIVAISDVKDESGALAPTPEGFRRIREGGFAIGDDPILRPLLERYEVEIFPTVFGTGIERAALQLAWDFSTGTSQHIVRDMLRARALVLEELGRTPPTVTVNAFFEGAGINLAFSQRPELTWRYVELTVTGPRVVNSEQPGAALARDEQGQARLNGQTSFEVSVILPATVGDAGVTASPLLYGHGFFGERTEVEGVLARRLVNDVVRPAFALSNVGMSTEDIGVVSGSIGNQVKETLLFGERVPQAMANWLTLSELIAAGALEPLTTTGAGGAVLTPFMHPNGVPVVGRDNFGYVGLSAGHITGGVMTALNARVRRSVLQVGGAGFTHMMFRARPFEGFLFFLDQSIPDKLDQQLITAQLQAGFDRFDPASYTPFISGPVPDGPDNGGDGRRVLLQIGRGDAQVPNLGSYMHARYLGIPFVTPSAIAAPADLPQASAPHEGSGLYIFDFGIDPTFEENCNIPSGPNLVHDAVRATPEALLQARTFLDSGVIVDPCDGGCGVLAPR